tara:strand:+ start:129 stop:716 length:588 start_codon:yes stop_codon:yes gene_type:complete
MSHSVDDIVKFTGSWFKNNQSIDDLDEQVKKAVEKVSIEFVTVLHNVLHDQTQPLQTRINELEGNKLTLTTQNKNLQKEKQDMKSEYDRKEQEMKSKYDLGKKELKTKYQKMNEDNKQLKAQDDDLEMQIREQNLFINDLTLENDQLRSQNYALNSQLNHYKAWREQEERKWSHGQNPQRFHGNAASNPYLIKPI